MLALATLIANCAKFGAFTGYTCQEYKGLRRAATRVGMAELRARQKQLASPPIALVATVVNAPLVAPCTLAMPVHGGGQGGGGSRGGAAATVAVGGGGRVAAAAAPQPAAPVGVGVAAPNRQHLQVAPPSFPELAQPPLAGQGEEDDVMSLAMQFNFG